jgi:hypothetical protein
MSSSMWLDVHRRVVKLIRMSSPEVSGCYGDPRGAASLQANGDTGDLEIWVIYFGKGKTLSGEETLALRTTKYPFMSYSLAMRLPLAEIEAKLRTEVAQLVETSDYHKAGCPDLVWLDDDGAIGIDPHSAPRAA